MKISALSLAFIATVVCAAAQAQDQDFNSGLKQELNQQQDVNQYPKRPKTRNVSQSEGIVQVDVQTVRPQNVQPAPQAPSAQVQPIYILQQPQGAPVAQVQPVTTVEAQEIKERKSEQLRKQREDLEHQTEDKLMERLEDDRVLSEKDRADRIFSGQVPPAASPAPVQVVPVAPAAAFQQGPAVTTAVVAVPEAVENAPVVSTTTVDVSSASAGDQDRSKFTLGGLAGIGAYPSVGNVSGTYSLGVIGEMVFPERLGVEAAALFSNYRVNLNGNNGGYFPYYMQLNQINVSGGLTYHVIDARVSPVIGVLASYTRRSYQNYGNSFQFSSPGGTSALDGGLLVGVDIMATKKLSIGADFRYFMNISNSPDNPYAYSMNFSGSPTMESLNYYIASINLKLAL